MYIADPIQYCMSTIQLKNAHKDQFSLSKVLSNSTTERQAIVAAF